MKNKINSSAYQSKALGLTNSIITLPCQSAHWGCAGISRQLHPLKVNDLMKDKVIKIKGRNDMRGTAYQLKALVLLNSNIPLLCQSAHRGCAGIGRQLHLLKVKDWNWMRDKISLANVMTQSFVHIDRSSHLYKKDCPFNWFTNPEKNRWSP